MGKKSKANDMRKKPRFYMELAIEVMKKSVDEVHKDSPSPRVGAVLVFSDGTYETAYRGEFREGDHAEYTLLDKKFRTKEVSDCWLFATLEPCGPGARKEPKLCCAERIGNARIKKVWYGVQELNSKAKGGNKYLQNLDVEVLPFDADLHHDILKFNKPFNDWVEEENKKAVMALKNINTQLQATIINADYTSLSKSALDLYISRTRKDYKIDSNELKSDLLNKELLVLDKNTGTANPTGDCILLFGDNPRDKFPQASVKAKVHYGVNIEPDAVSFDDPLVLIPDKVENWCKKVLPESIDRSTFSKSKTNLFPTPIIREAIINAIIHRDYSNKNAKVLLDITPEKIEISSPGAPISPNTLEDLQHFTAISQTRNPELAYIFNSMDFMEETGIGMDTFRSMHQNFNLLLPLINFEKNNLIVTFPRSVNIIRSTLNNNFLRNLKDDELVAYDIFRSYKNVSKKEFADWSNLPSRSAERLLKDFVDNKVIKRVGSGPSTKYIIS